MKHLNDESIKKLRELIPDNCYFLLIVTSKEGTGLDTNIPADQVVQFLQETAHNVVFDCTREAVQNVPE